MGIPIGKLSLYTLIGGIDPARTLPIVLDVGTDNVELLRRPPVPGWRHRRIDDDEYYAFIDRFVPQCTSNSRRAAAVGRLRHRARAADPRPLPRQVAHLQRRHPGHGRRRRRCATWRGEGRRPALSQQNIVMLGAGSAGIGVLDMIRREMVTEGLSEQAATERIWVVDVVGLLTDDRNDLSDAQRDFAQPAGRVADWGLAGRLSSPTSYTTSMSAFCSDCPLPPAHSLKTSCARWPSKPSGRSSSRSPIRRVARKAHPAELDHWTDGRALIATGSPFAPLERNGVEYPVAQCNNVYIFPAIGLAVTAAQATRVTDEMMRVAAATLGEASPALNDPDQPLLPSWSDAPDVAIRSRRPSRSRPSPRASPRNAAARNSPNGSRRCTGTLSIRRTSA